MFKKWTLLSGFAAVFLVTGLLFQNCGQQGAGGSAGFSSEFSSALTSEGLSSVDSGLVEPEPAIKDTSPILNKITRSDVSINKSIMITNHKVLNDVVKDMDFGHLLAKYYQHLKNDVAPTRGNNFQMGSETVGEFVAHIFLTADRDQRRHRDTPNSQNWGRILRTTATWVMCSICVDLERMKSPKSRCPARWTFSLACDHESYGERGHHRQSRNEYSERQCARLG